MMQQKTPQIQASSTHVEFTSIEHLFRTKPLAEIRSLHRETEKNLSQKKKDLRLLVGNHYRQVLESSDLVGEIQKCAAEFQNSLNEIQKIQAQPVTWNLVSVDRKKLAQLIDAPAPRRRTIRDPGSSATGAKLAEDAASKHDEEQAQEQTYEFCRKMKQLLELPETMRAKLLSRNFFEAVELLLVTLPRLYADVEETIEKNTSQKGGADSSASAASTSVFAQSRELVARHKRQMETSRSAVVSACMEALSATWLTPEAFAEAVACLMYFARDRPLSHFLTLFGTRRLETMKAKKATANLERKQDIAASASAGGAKIASRLQASPAQSPAAKGTTYTASDAPQEKQHMNRLCEELILYEASFLCLHAARDRVRDNLKTLVALLAESPEMLAKTAPSAESLLNLLVVDDKAPDAEQLAVMHLYENLHPGYRFPRCGSLQRIHQVCQETSELLWSYRFQSDYKTLWPAFMEYGANLPDTLLVLRDKAATEMTALLESSVFQISNPLKLDSFEPQLGEIVQDIASLPVQYAQNSTLSTAFSDIVYNLFYSCLVEDHEPQSNDAAASAGGGSASGRRETRGGSSSSTRKNIGGGAASAVLRTAEAGLDLYQLVEWLRDRKTLQDKYYLTDSDGRLVALLSKTAGEILEQWLAERVRPDLLASLYAASSSASSNMEYQIATQQIDDSSWGTLVNRPDPVKAVDGGGEAPKYQIPVSASPALLEFFLNLRVAEFFSKRFQYVPDDASSKIKDYLCEEFRKVFVEQLASLQVASGANSSGGLPPMQLQLLFDARYLRRLFEQRFAATAEAIEGAVLADPVDRLLYTEPIDRAVAEFLESTAVLLAPLCSAASEGDAPAGGSMLLSQTLGGSSKGPALFTRLEHDPPLCTHAMRFPQLPVIDNKKQTPTVPQPAVQAKSFGGAGLFAGASSGLANLAGWNRG
ncbi:unnamed protein product [Amoebophrya sp. A25]|nr:unnamed protein product [Amoebophrya sp. A25]|eukprot:GSA25T00002223001.1